MTHAVIRRSWRFTPGTGRHGLLGLALLVGVGAGLGAVVFRYLVEWLTEAFTGYRDYSGLGHVANPNFPALGPYFVLFTPIVAGLLYGPLVYRFAREARGHGVPEVMVAVTRHGGRIRPQVAVVKALASALCIGGGGSVGREGPIVQIGSALGSSLGQLLHLDERRLRLLVACGAAGGIAATFNAPLAGVFFAMELILRVWTAETFGLVVLSSVTASVIGRSILGNHPFLALPAFHVAHLMQYPLFALLGILAGLIGVAFSRILYAVEDACDWAWRGPEWLRPAVGGILLGVVLLVLPEMYGVGYPVVGKAVAGGYGIAFLLVLLVGKLTACSLTIGIGGSGGVFAPSLFCGAMAGAAFGDVVHADRPAGRRFGRRVRTGRDGSSLRRRRPSADHRRGHHVRTDRRIHHHPAAHARDRAGHRGQRTRLPRHGLHPQTPTARHRHRRTGRRHYAPPRGVHGHGHPARGDTGRRHPRLRPPRCFSQSGEVALPVVDRAGHYLGNLAARDLMDALAAAEHTASPP